MLSPKNDRLDYGQILSPPSGFSLDFAVGATYSLDLDALVGASLALGLSEETDSELLDNPVFLLEVLRSTGDKVALFCQSGQIHMPTKVTSLYILLEKVVFPVRAAVRQGLAAFPSFHPKLWLIRFRDRENSICYRVIVLSRNLTFDRSWDVTYTMNGEVGSTRTEKNDPLSDFLLYLLSQLPPDEAGGKKAKGIRSMIEELPYVRFELKEKEFYDYQFLPVGIKKAKGGFHQAEAIAPFRDSFSLHELFVMSPFLSKEIICAFNNHNTVRNARYLLITRESSLEKLKKEDADRFQIYTLRDEIIDGESAISGDGQSFQKQDIHAKVYMTRKDSDSDLYLGSLNASHNAVSGNVEFMLRLRAKNRYLNLDKLTAALFGGEQDGNPFQEVSLRNAQTEQEDEIQNDLEEVIKRIDRSNPTAHIEADGETTFRISVCFGECDTKGMSVQIRPLLSERTEPFQNTVVFSHLPLTKLSEFYAAAVSDGERTVKRVLVIPTEGMPEEREKAVVAGVVSNEDCFYRYVAFLLGENAILSILDADAAAGTANGTLYRGDYHIPALYEKMLRTAAAAPEKFEGIEYLMRAISENGIVPEDFKRLYELFRRVVKPRGKSR